MKTELDRLIQRLKAANFVDVYSTGGSSLVPTMMEMLRGYGPIALGALGVIAALYAIDRITAQKAEQIASGGPATLTETEAKTIADVMASLSISTSQTIAGPVAGLDTAGLSFAMPTITLREDHTAESVMREALTKDRDPCEFMRREINRIRSMFGGVPRIYIAQKIAPPGVDGILFFNQCNMTYIALNNAIANYCNGSDYIPPDAVGHTKSPTSGRFVPLTEGAGFFPQGHTAEMAMAQPFQMPLIMPMDGSVDGFIESWFPDAAPAGTITKDDARSIGLVDDLAGLLTAYASPHDPTKCRRIKDAVSKFLVTATKVGRVPAPVMQLLQRVAEYMEKWCGSSPWGPLTN